MLSTNRVLSGIFRKGLSSVARYAIIIIILALASPCLISCKKTMDLVEAKPHVSELVVVQAHGKKMAADIDISDLLAVWKNNLPTTEAPQFQDPYEASCGIVHEFSKAGKTAGFLSPGSQVWFGIGYALPAGGKASSGWYILRTETPNDYVGKRAIEKIKALNVIDDSTIASPVVFHTEYRSSDWDTVKKIVEGKTVADDHPFIKDLRTLRGGGPYPLIATSGISTVIIHDEPLVEPPIKNYTPLYLRQNGRDLYGIQRR